MLRSRFHEDSSYGRTGSQRNHVSTSICAVQLLRPLTVSLRPLLGAERSVHTLKLVVASNRELFVCAQQFLLDRPAPRQNQSLVLHGSLSRARYMVRSGYCLLASLGTLLTSLVLSMLFLLGVGENWTSMPQYFRQQGYKSYSIGERIEVLACLCLRPVPFSSQVHRTRALMSFVPRKNVSSWSSTKLRRAAQLGPGCVSFPTRNNPSHLQEPGSSLYCFCCCCRRCRRRLHVQVYYAGTCNTTTNGWPVLQPGVANVECRPATTNCEPKSAVTAQGENWCALNESAVSAPLAVRTPRKIVVVYSVSSQFKQHLLTRCLATFFLSYAV